MIFFFFLIPGGKLTWLINVMPATLLISLWLLEGLHRNRFSVLLTHRTVVGSLIMNKQRPWLGDIFSDLTGEQAIYIVLISHKIFITCAMLLVIKSHAQQTSSGAKLSDVEKGASEISDGKYGFSDSNWQGVQHSMKCNFLWGGGNFIQCFYFSNYWIKGPNKNREQKRRTSEGWTG